MEWCKLPLGWSRMNARKRTVWLMRAVIDPLVEMQHEARMTAFALTAPGTFDRILPLPAVAVLLQGLGVPMLAVASNGAVLMELPWSAGASWNSEAGHWSVWVRLPTEDGYKAVLLATFSEYGLVRHAEISPTEWSMGLAELQVRFGSFDHLELDRLPTEAWWHESHVNYGGTK